MCSRPARPRRPTAAPDPRGPLPSRPRPVPPASGARSRPPGTGGSLTSSPRHRVRPAPQAGRRRRGGACPPPRAAAPSPEEEAVSASRGTQRTDPATSRLAGWIEPVVDGRRLRPGGADVTPAGRRSVVRVVVDRDSGVTLDDVAEVSRAVSEVLDDPTTTAGPHALRARGDQPRGRPPAHRAAALAAQRRPAGRRSRSGRPARPSRSPAGSPRSSDAGVELAVEAHGQAGREEAPAHARPVPWDAARRGPGAGRVRPARRRRRAPDRRGRRARRATSIDDDEDQTTTARGGRP